MGKEKICVALDVDSFEEALDLTRRLSPWVGVFKIGSQLFTSEGSGIVKAVIEEGAEVFLDLKYHDIPNTVLNAARVALKLGVKMFNVHCLGGARMMRMLVDALGREAEITGKPMPLLLGVTVLTSLSNEELESELRVSLPLEEYVVHLAKLAQDAGMDGVVCSPHELVPIRRACGPNFTLVTPGIRPDWASGRDDQRRFTSPQAAFRAGADYIVVGRPITAANGPEDAAQRLLLELSS